MFSDQDTFYQFHLNFELMIFSFTDTRTCVNRYTSNLYTCNTYTKPTHTKSYEIHTILILYLSFFSVFYAYLQAKVQSDPFVPSEDVPDQRIV